MRHPRRQTDATLTRHETDAIVILIARGKAVIAPNQASLLASSMNFRKISCFAMLLSTMASSAVFAADDKPASGAAPPAGAIVQASATSAKRPAVSPDDRVICETVEEIGSRLGDRKVCQTRREWREQGNIRGGMMTSVVGGCRSDIYVPGNAKC